MAGMIIQIGSPTVALSVQPLPQVDNVPVPNATASRFLFAPSQLGSYQVSVQVRNPAGSASSTPALVQFTRQAVLTTVATRASA